MRLLFDENLSPKLSVLLQDLYADSKHMEECGLGKADDSVIWAYARDQGFIIVTKDFDFYQRSVAYGAPPKVIWLQLRNCTTAQIQEFAARSEETCLAITAKRANRA